MMNLLKLSNLPYDWQMTRKGRHKVFFELFFSVNSLVKLSLCSRWEDVVFVFCIVGWLFFTFGVRC